jgi:hypothetical protein
MPSEEDIQTLLQARERAKRLLEELVKKQAEVEASPPPISPEQLQAGRAAMENAIAASRRMLRRLDEALAMGLNPVDEPEDEPDDNAN